MMSGVGGGPPKPHPHAKEVSMMSLVPSRKWRGLDCRGEALAELAALTMMMHKLTSIADVFLEQPTTVIPEIAKCLAVS